MAFPYMLQSAKTSGAGAASDAKPLTWHIEEYSGDEDGFPMSLAATIDFLRSQGLTFSSRPGKLEAVHELVGRVETAGIPGLFLEAGVAMGGSAIVIAKAKAAERELRLYDVFQVPPPPGKNDDTRAHSDYRALVEGRANGPAARNYLAHRDDLLEYVRGNMRHAGIDPEVENVRFFKGPYEETLEIEEAVAFAHVDCDWYDSVTVCIDRIVDRLTPGGLILFDDYTTYPGCRRAVDEWLARDPRFSVVHSAWALAAERRRTDGNGRRAAFDRFV